MKLRPGRMALAYAPALLPVLFGCGCGGAAPAPAVSADRASGQSGLMDRTFAGANRCDSKNHARPFVIEWDGTDASSFQSQAADNVVVVKYEGCDLEVLEGCTPDVKGSLGAYGPVEWTSGGLEKIDIRDEHDLFSKLPLAASPFGERVAAGEQFHMEYYVSGTRTATRDAVYRGDLDRTAACKGATHFVHAYNLGAFALGSRKEIKGELGATVWGIGQQSSHHSLNDAEKRGGVLVSCTGDSAREVETCKVPIRLSLRPITEGASPEAKPLTATEENRFQQSDERLGHVAGIMAKHNAGDGPGCLAELDAYDRTLPSTSPPSTDPKGSMSSFRAHCVMLAGHCMAGKELLRKSSQAWTPMGPDAIDTFVDNIGADYCRGPMPPREELLAAAATLRHGVSMKKLTPTECREAYRSVQRLAPTAKPRDESDQALKSAADLRGQASSAVGCLVHAGDCKEAFATYLASMRSSAPGGLEGPGGEGKARADFVHANPACREGP